MLGKLAAILVCSLNPSELRASLERDGYGVDCAKVDLIPLEGPVKIQEQDDVFRHLIQSVKFPHHNEILKHLTDATDLFSESGERTSGHERSKEFSSTAD